MKGRLAGPWRVVALALERGRAQQVLEVTAAGAAGSVTQRWLGSRLRLPRRPQVPADREEWSRIVEAAEQLSELDIAFVTVLGAARAASQVRQGGALVIDLSQPRKAVRAWIPLAIARGASVLLCGRSSVVDSSHVRAELRLTSPSTRRLVVHAPECERACDLHYERQTGFFGHLVTGPRKTEIEEG